MGTTAELSLRLLDLGAVDPYTAQTLVEALAPSVATGESPATLVVATPTAPYASLGFHQVYGEEVDDAFVGRTGVPVIRRVTGGGTTWLDLSQVFFEYVYPMDGGLPGGPEAFPRLLVPPLRYLRSLGLFARLRPPSDLVVGERKISGNAGGEWEGANIVQGGLLGHADVDQMVGILRSPHPAFRDLLRSEMRAQLTSVSAELGRPVEGGELRAGLLATLRADPHLRLVPGEVSPREARRYQDEVLPRHRDPTWLNAPARAADPSDPPRRVRIAGSRFLEGWRISPDPPDWRFRIVEEGRPLRTYEAPGAERYRDLGDLRSVEAPPTRR